MSDAAPEVRERAVPEEPGGGTGARLPVAGGPGVERLADQAVRYWNIRSVVGDVVILALCAGAIAIFRAEWMFFWGPWVVAPLVVVSGLLDVLLFNRIEFRNYSFTVTEDYVYVARGRWFRTSATIPTSQILNVSTAQGPLLRAAGLVKVQFTCLLDVDGIGPITQEDADRIRRTVLNQQPDERVDETVDGIGVDEDVDAARPAG